MKVFNEKEVSSRTCEIIKFERKWRDLTQLEMASELGISQSALSKIENGMTPTLIPWLKFCSKFDLPSDLPVNLKHYKSWAKRTVERRRPLAN
jgi:DNA-binding XRE family transcriptional regulator